MSDNTAPPAPSDKIERFIRRIFTISSIAIRPSSEPNISPECLDHDAEVGRTIDLAEATEPAKPMFARLRDPEVDVRDVLVDGEKTVVRNVWTATDAETGERIEFHRFVLLRIADGKIVERWATITEPREMANPLAW